MIPQRSRQLVMKPSINRVVASAVHFTGGRLASRCRFYSTPRIQEIKSKEKKIHDHLSPTNSNLLNISLSDHLPKECLTPLRPSSETSGSPSLPQGHHLVYFPIQARPSELHADGTDMDHWPGPPFMRRVWGGGEVVFTPGWERHMRLDARPVVCTETVEDVRVSGAEATSNQPNPKAKAFVDVWRRYGVADGGLAPMIQERRTLVFMPELGEGDAAKKSARRLVKAPHNPDYSFALTPTRALLANFSALTYNAHSIHLDTALTLAEGHRGLLVHGPLTLTLMFAALRGKLVSGNVATGNEAVGDAVHRLEYRNVAPLYADEELKVCLREKTGLQAPDEEGQRKWDVWVEGKDGGMAVKGTATTGPLSTPSFNSEAT